MNTGVDVSCESSGFAQRELCCWGTTFCSSGVGNGCTITDGPDARRIRNGQHGIDNDGAAFVVLDSKGLEKRIRDCTSCPYECLRANLFVFLMAVLYRACITPGCSLSSWRFARSTDGLQDHHTLPCICQARIELEGDASLLHTFQCISRE